MKSIWRNGRQNITIFSSTDSSTTVQYLLSSISYLAEFIKPLQNNTKGTSKLEGKGERDTKEYEGINYNLFLCKEILLNLKHPLYNYISFKVQNNE